jgi:hypothetical protein
MMQLYSKKSSSDKEMQPKKETIQFLLDYSKQLQFKKTKANTKIELNLN